jgi:hypothetical protein
MFHVKHVAEELVVAPAPPIMISACQRPSADGWLQGKSVGRWHRKCPLFRVGASRVDERCAEGIAGEGQWSAARGLSSRAATHP